MSDFLINLIKRSAEPEAALRPRLAALFEPQMIGSRLWPEKFFTPGSTDQIDASYEGDGVPPVQASGARTIDHSHQAESRPAEARFTTAAPPTQRIDEHPAENTPLQPLSSIMPTLPAAEPLTPLAEQEIKRERESSATPTADRAQAGGESKELSGGATPTQPPTTAHAQSLINEAMEKASASSHQMPAQSRPQPEAASRLQGEVKRSQAPDADLHIERIANSSQVDKSFAEEAAAPQTDRFNPPPLLTEQRRVYAKVAPPSLASTEHGYPETIYRERAESVAPSTVVARPVVTPSSTPEPFASVKEETAEPSVQVTIGRIEVRAAVQPETDKKRERPSPSLMSLDDYLSQRAKGGSR